MSTVLRRFRAIIITLVLVAGANIAISYAANVPILPDGPRPGTKANVPILPDGPRPGTKANVPILPDGPRPGSVR